MNKKESKNIFSASLAMMKKPRSMVIAAMLIAFIIVLDQPLLSIRVSEGLKMNFIFIPVMLCASFYGPVTCAFACVIGDLLGVVLTGEGVVFPLLLVELVRGFLMGCIMFRKEPKLGRIVVAQSVANLFVNMCLNTAVLISIGYLSAQNVFLSIGTRVLKNIVFLPVEILVLFVLFKSLTVAMKKNNLRP